MTEGPVLPFVDRADAGRRLASALPPLDPPLVLGLARGGVPVAAAVAAELGANAEYVWNVARTHGTNVNREYAEVFQVYRVIA